jgi:serine protein kinase
MIRWGGCSYEEGQFHGKLFDDELFGIDESLGRLVDYFTAASAGSEVGRRLLLLLGPPSGGKSTLVILLKRGLEEYSHTEAGAMYGIQGCPVDESPLHLIPHTLRPAFRETYGVEASGELCPFCTSRLTGEFAGDFMQMQVQRIFISEAGRVGVGTYAPHDPTTADIADLVGSVDLSKVAEYGDEGDPRAWSWSGAVYAASRGLLEMIEILKVKREFLYLLLTLTQEKNVKVSRFPLIYLDETIIAHTNLAEFRKFLQEAENEALLDRMVIIQVPYRFPTRKRRAFTANSLRARKRSRKSTSTRTCCAWPPCSPSSRAWAKPRTRRRSWRKKCACMRERTLKACRAPKPTRSGKRSPTRGSPACLRAS